MKDLSERDLDEIIADIRQTRKQVEKATKLKLNPPCHFQVMTGSLVQHLSSIKDLRQAIGDVKARREVSKVLREINDYFAFLGKNERFRNYEFNSNVDSFEGAPEELIGYTAAMSEYFVE
jgi:hypothetical protein